MSTEATAAARRSSWGLRPWTRDLRTAKIVRFTVGSTAAAVAAFAYEWPLSFVCPLLTIVFLSKQIPGFTHRQWYPIAYVIGAMLLGLSFTLFLHPYPMVFVPMLGLVLFHLFYYLNRGGSFVFGIVSLLSVLILPMMTAAHEQLAIVFALYFAFSAALAVLIFILAHELFPDPPGSPEPPPARFVSGYSAAAAKASLTSTLAVLPLVVVFNAFELSGELVALIYAVILSLQAESSAGWKEGMKMLKATLIGSLATILVYWLLVAVPEMHFFMIVWLATMLIFARLIFSDHPMSKYAGSAATAMTILIATSLGEGADYVGKIVTRIGMIVIAALYVGVALAIVQRYVFSTGNPPEPARE